MMQTTRRPDGGHPPDIMLALADPERQTAIRVLDDILANPDDGEDDGPHQLPTIDVAREIADRAGDGTPEEVAAYHAILHKLAQSEITDLNVEGKAVGRGDRFDDAIAAMDHWVDQYEEGER